MAAWGDALGALSRLPPGSTFSLRHPLGTRALQPPLPAREQRLMEAVGWPGWGEPLSSGRDRTRADQSRGFMSRRGISRNELGVGLGPALGSQDPGHDGLG